MAVTPNIASNLTPGIVVKKIPSNPSMSPGKTSKFAGFNPEYQAGDVVKGGTSIQPLNGTFYAHIK